MLFLVADENFNNDIVRGLLCVKPNLDIAEVCKHGELQGQIIYLPLSK